MKKDIYFNISGFKYFCLFVLLSFGILVLSACTNSSVSNFKIISINNQQIKVEVVSTLVKQAHGLSDRKFMAANQGMLFVFDNYVQPGFWMKDMHFPLDIVWLKDYTIMKINKNVLLENNQNLTIYKPDQPINAVLELNAGYTEKNNIKIGAGVKVLNYKL